MAGQQRFRMTVSLTTDPALWYLASMLRLNKSRVFDTALRAAIMERWEEMKVSHTLWAEHVLGEISDVDVRAALRRPYYARWRK